MNKFKFVSVLVALIVTLSGCDKIQEVTSMAMPSSEVGFMQSFEGRWVTNERGSTFKVVDNKLIGIEETGHAPVIMEVTPSGKYDESNQNLSVQVKVYTLTDKILDEYSKRRSAAHIKEPEVIQNGRIVSPNVFFDYPEKVQNLTALRELITKDPKLGLSSMNERTFNAILRNSSQKPDSMRLELTDDNGKVLYAPDFVRELNTKEIEVLTTYKNLFTVFDTFVPEMTEKYIALINGDIAKAEETIAIYAEQEEMEKNRLQQQQ